MHSSFHPIATGIGTPKGKQRAKVTYPKESHGVIGNHAQIKRFAERLFIVAEQRRQMAHVLDRMASAEAGKIV